MTTTIKVSFDEQAKSVVCDVAVTSDTESGDWVLAETVRLYKLAAEQTNRLTLQKMVGTKTN